MAEGEIKRRILDFLRSNGKSTALNDIVKHLGVSRKIVNKHLYSLEESKVLKKINGSPPIWDLMERTVDPTPAVNPDIEFEEEKLSEILKSGGKTGLKAHEIAKDMGQDRKTVNKHLYSLKDEGKAQISENNKWIYTENLQQDSQPSVDPKASDSGLSQCLDVIDILGEGGYGCVYKVQHKIDGKMYAVKKVVMTNDADTEVKTLAKLEHPNIVRYITCWSSSQDWTSCLDASDQSDPSIDIVFDGSSNEASDADISGVETLSLSSESESPAKPSQDHRGSDHANQSRVYLFIKMEFCEGGTLTAWINERNMNKKQRKTTEILQIFHEIVNGVEYVHSQNLIHRDLKPDNILFGAEGKVKIGDFGLVATLTNPNGSAVSRTKGRGTKSYMSPEQELQSNYDAKTDIFPLGLIWFEMLWVLSTGMERVELWPDLRNQTFPKEFCDQYRTEHKFIRMMLSHAPQRRPQAKDIKEKLDTFFSMDQNLRQKTT